MYQQKGGFNGGRGNFSGGGFNRGGGDMGSGRGGFGGGQGDNAPYGSSRIGRNGLEWKYLDGWHSQQELDADNRNLGLAIGLAPFTCGMSLMGYGWLEASDYEQGSQGGYGQNGYGQGSYGGYR